MYNFFKNFPVISYNGSLSLNLLARVKFTNIVKVFRGLSILLVRIPLWIGILQVFYPINKLICFGILIFIFLDIFWLYIIYINATLQAQS